MRILSCPSLAFFLTLLFAATCGVSVDIVGVAVWVAVQRVRVVRWEVIDPCSTEQETTW